MRSGPADLATAELENAEILPDGKSAAKFPSSLSANPEIDGVRRLLAAFYSLRQTKLSLQISIRATACFRLDFY